MASNHKGWSLTLTGDDDPTAAAVPAPVGTLYQNTADGTIYSKTGKADNAWTQYAPLTDRQVFSYVCNGTETDTFTIALPDARASAAYQVQITMFGPAANALKLYRAISTSFTVNGFDVELSAPAEAGDVLSFIVDDPT